MTKHNEPIYVDSLEQIVEPGMLVLPTDQLDNNGRPKSMRWLSLVLEIYRVRPGIHYAKVEILQKRKDSHMSQISYPDLLNLVVVSGRTEQ